jgi:hypothetical protein
MSCRSRFEWKTHDGFFARRRERQRARVDLSRRRPPRRPSPWAGDLRSLPLVGPPCRSWTTMLRRQKQSVSDDLARARHGFSYRPGDSGGPFAWGVASHVASLHEMRAIQAALNAAKRNSANSEKTPAGLRFPRVSAESSANGSTDFESPASAIPPVGRDFDVGPAAISRSPRAVGRYFLSRLCARARKHVK